MDDVELLLKAHFSRYPLMESQDAVKLLYQGEFGPSHLTACESGSFEKLSAEYEATDSTGEPLNDYICGGMSRVHVAAAKAAGIAPLTLNKLFLLSAKSQEGSMAQFESKLACLLKICEEGAPFTKAALNSFLSRWRALKMPKISHSSAYREHYKPSYRVLISRYANFIPLFAAVDKRFLQGKTIIIGIDGNCGAGKSTLASLLAAVYKNSCIIPMDNFYLTKAKQALVLHEGNIDHERFSQLASPIKRFEKFSYAPFNCLTGEYAKQEEVLPDKLIIVEGSYCLHTKHSALYDIRVFLECPHDEQLMRLEKRSPEKLSRFISEWIPAENAYFERYNIKHSSDYVFKT